MREIQPGTTILKTVARISATRSEVYKNKEYLGRLPGAMYVSTLRGQMPQWTAHLVGRHSNQHAGTAKDVDQATKIYAYFEYEVPDGSPFTVRVGATDTTGRQNCPVA